MESIIRVFQYWPCKRWSNICIFYEGLLLPWQQAQPTTKSDLLLITKDGICFFVMFSCFHLCFAVFAFFCPNACFGSYWRLPSTAFGPEPFTFRFFVSAIGCHNFWLKTDGGVFEIYDFQTGVLAPFPTKKGWSSYGHSLNISMPGDIVIVLRRPNFPLYEVFLGPCSISNPETGIHIVSQFLS